MTVTNRDQLWALNEVGVVFPCLAQPYAVKRSFLWEQFLRSATAEKEIFASAIFAFLFVI